MPFRKKKNNNNKSSYSIAKTALKKVNRLASQVEKKHYDLDFLGPLTLDNQGTRISLNVGIEQGTTDSQRIGDRIKCLGLRCKMLTLLNSAEFSSIRYILMWDKEDSIALASDFLSATGTANVINSPYKVDDRHRYMILKDKVISMSQGHGRIVQINMSKKINKFTQYEGGTTDVTRGLLKLWIFCEKDSLTSPRPQIEGWSRVHYADS